MADVVTMILKANDNFALVEGPIDHKQHANQRNGLDKYVKVYNLKTGEPCFKKLYRNSKGLYFKHSGYPPSYLDEMCKTVEVIPYQYYYVEE